jgi:hypothetical protein
MLFTVGLEESGNYCSIGSPVGEKPVGSNATDKFHTKFHPNGATDPRETFGNLY